MIQNLLLLIVSLSQLVQTHKTKQGLDVLVFGGNGFIGAEIVLALLADGHRVTTVNRGSAYWDSAERVLPHVTQWRCDRTRLSDCQQLAQLRWADAVVDLTTYRRRDMLSLIDALTDKTSLFVYISSDSVYEVCVTAEHALTAGSREEDAVRPADRVQRQQLAGADSYGNHKLAGEELLREQRSNGGFPFVALRLPDVIGNRDNTLRWWAYQLWIRSHAEMALPLHVPSWLSQRQLSFVLAEDVAKTVVSLIARNESHMWDQAYNLAFTERCSLEDLLKMIAFEMGIASLETSNDGPVQSYLFPSVTRGPLNVTRAQQTLRWQPTSLKDAVQKTVHFYEEAWRRDLFPRELEAAEEYLARRVLSGTWGEKFRTTIGKLRPEASQTSRTDEL